MSGPIDETFTEQQLVPGTVFELGCSPGFFTARMAKRPELKITAIDLYPAECSEGFEFIQGDIMDYKPPHQFDNVCCVSSWEHCGIERANFWEESSPSTDYHLLVAEKLKSLVVPNGRLIITCPFGPDEVWLTDGKGTNFKMGDSKYSHLAARWGFRTFSLETLKSIFQPFSLVRASACALVAEEYFELSNWVRIDVEKDHAHFTNENVNRAVIGVVFQNNDL